MWKQILPNSSHDWEPLELRMLKRGLANLACQCHICKYSELDPDRRFIDQKHKEVQAELQSEFTQARPYCSQDKNFCPSGKDICPSCFFTLNLLRGAATKVVKDEESETKTQMFSRDKCTGKRLKFLEKSTSVTNKPVLKYSNFSLCDEMSEYSSDLLPTEKKKRNHERVTFLGLEDKDLKEQALPRTGMCLCMDNFVDSIRPPLGDTHICSK